MAMGAGGFAYCADCGEYLWSCDEQGRCAQCVARASAESAATPVMDADPVDVTPAAPPDAVEPVDSGPKPGPTAKELRKKLMRKYEKGKLGAKPSRKRLTRLADALWADLLPADRDRLLEEVGALGFSSAEPVEAVVDFYEATLRKAERKAAKNSVNQVSSEPVSS